MSDADIATIAQRWSEIEVNRVWLNAVANVIEQRGEFTLAPHDVLRLREIAEQLRAAT